MSQIQVSVVANAKAVDCTTADAAELIRGFRPESDLIAKIRAAYSDAPNWGVEPKDAISELKKGLPGVLWSGTFSKRGKAFLEKYSGLLVADLDDLKEEELRQAREVLTKDPHVWALFTSPSGRGLKVVFRVKADAGLHLNSFYAAAGLIRRQCGLEVDQSGKDLARLCFISQDNDAYLNEAAVELEPEAKPQGEKIKAPEPRASIVDYAKRRATAESLLGSIRWETDTLGYCDCPGRAVHTTGDGPQDARVTIDGAPTLFCFHNSCQSAVEQANSELRSRIAKVELVAGGIQDRAAARTVLDLAAMDPVSYEQVRKAEALRLGVRPKVLDDLVKAQQKLTKAGLSLQKAPQDSIKWDENPLRAIYDSNNQVWWVPAKDGNYIKVNENAVRRILQHVGFDSEAEDGQLSPLQLEIMRCQLESHVAYVGAVAGYPAGLHPMEGGRLLVPYSSRPPAAKDTPCPQLQAFLEGMLGREQFWRFIAWVKFRRMSVTQNKWMPGQALALVGPAKCGKSYTQHLITLLLGGGVAKPWRYLSGGTEFNGDLIGAAHLAVEDDAPKADLPTRRLVGAQIKSMLYSRMQSAHSKGRQALHLDPKWTLTFSLNDEPENLMILPPIDESLQDKISIFKCAMVPRPVPPDMDEQDWLLSVTSQELPGLAYLVDTMTVPDAWFDPRSGIQAYRHPEIEAALTELAPEAQLIDLIDDVIFDGPSVTKWSGKASQLVAELQASRRATEFHRIDSYRNAIAHYLGRLSRRPNPRVIQQRIETHNEWIIYRKNFQPAENADLEVGDAVRPF